MKPGELYKPHGFDCVLLCVGPDTFTVEAGESPFHPDPLSGKISFSQTPPMHRAWHWSDLATDAQAAYAKDDGNLLVLVGVEALRGGKIKLVLNENLYFYENNL